MPNNSVNIWIRVKDAFSVHLRRASTMFHRFGARILTSGRSVAAALFVVTGAFIGAIKKAHEFGRAMARVEALMGGAKLKGLRDDVMSVSTAFGINAVEAAEGFYQAVSAGVPVNEVKKFMMVAARAAKVDGSNIKDAVLGVTTVLNAFKLEVSEADRITDLMFTTVTNGVTTFQELSTNLSTAAPLAASLGVSINDLLGAAASLTKQGVSTAEAMTQIRAAMLSANEVLGDGWAQTYSLVDAFQVMRSMAGGSDKALREMVGRVEAMNGILGLTGRNFAEATEDARKFKEEIQKLSDISDGTTDEISIWSRFGTEVNRSFVKFGTVITELVDGPLTKLTEKLKEINDLQGQSEAEKMMSDAKKSGFMKSFLGGVSSGAPFGLRGLMVGMFSGALKGVLGQEGIERAMRESNAYAQARAKDIAAVEAAEVEAERNQRSRAFRANRFFRDVLAGVRQVYLTMQALQRKELSKHLSILEDLEEKTAKAMAKMKRQYIANEIADLRKAASEQARLGREGVIGPGGGLVIPEQHFSDKLREFNERRDADKKARDENRKITERMDRIAEKEAREARGGFKMSRADREFKKRVMELAEQERKRAAALAKEKEIEKEIRNLLKSNLQIGIDGQGGN